MITTTSAVAINRSRADVFSFICDPKKAALWHSGLTEFRAEKGMPTGSSGELTLVIMGRQLRSTFDILENDGIGFTRSRSRQGPIQYETTQMVAPIDDMRTTVTVQTRINAETVFKLAEPALESIASSHMDMDLQTLKTILEARI